MSEARGWLKPPLLIDTLLAHTTGPERAEVLIEGRWYVARWVSLPGWRGAVLRIWHAWLVLAGRARAFQFMEDRCSPVEWLK